MAQTLTPCRGCETPVASSAKACPKCGANKPATSTAQYFGAFVLMAVVGTVAWFACGDSEPEPALPPADAHELAEKCFSGWSGNHRGFETEVRDVLNDPDSMEVHGTYFNSNDSITDDGMIRIRMDYSAANAYGGMVRATL